MELSFNNFSGNVGQQQMLNQPSLDPIQQQNPTFIINHVQKIEVTSICVVQIQEDNNTKFYQYYTNSEPQTVELSSTYLNNIKLPSNVYQSNIIPQNNNQQFSYNTNNCNLFDNSQMSGNQNQLYSINNTNTINPSQIKSNNPSNNSLNKPITIIQNNSSTLTSNNPSPVTNSTSSNNNTNNSTNNNSNNISMEFINSPFDNIAQQSTEIKTNNSDYISFNDCESTYSNNDVSTQASYPHHSNNRVVQAKMDTLLKNKMTRRYHEQCWVVLYNEVKEVLKELENNSSQNTSSYEKINQIINSVKRCSYQASTVQLITEGKKCGFPSQLLKSLYSSLNNEKEFTKSYLVTISKRRRNSKNIDAEEEYIQTAGDLLLKKIRKFI